jgi:hypothetical protein
MLVHMSMMRASGVRPDASEVDIAWGEKLPSAGAPSTSILG